MLKILHLLPAGASQGGKEAGIILNAHLYYRQNAAALNGHLCSTKEIKLRWMSWATQKRG